MRTLSYSLAILAVVSSTSFSYAGKPTPSTQKISSIKVGTTQIETVNTPVDQTYTVYPLVAAVNTFPGTPGTRMNTTWTKDLTIGGAVISSLFVSNHTPTNAGVLPVSPSATALGINFVDIYMNYKPIDWVFGHFAYSFGQQVPGFIYNAPGNGNTFYLREAYAKLGNTKDFPYYARAGLAYVPFGASEYSSLMDSPYRLMTLTSGRPSVTFGFESLKGFEGAVYSFVPIGMKSQSDKGETTRIHDFGAHLGYSQQFSQSGYAVGFGYINNMIGTLYVLSTTAHASTIASPKTYARRTDGVEIHASGNYGPFDGGIKYVTTLKAFDVNEVPFYQNGALRGAKPAAWGLNLGYSLNDASRFAVGYQGTKESIAYGTASGATTPFPITSPYYSDTAKAAGGLPLNRFYANYTRMLNKWVSVAGEIDRDKYYSSGTGGTGKSSWIGVLQLRVRV